MQNLNDVISSVSIEQPELTYEAGRIYRKGLNHGKFARQSFPQKFKRYSKSLREMYSKEEVEEAATWIDDERDNLLTFLGSQTLATRYQLHDGDGTVIETAQERFLATAMYLARGDMQLARQAYDALSTLQMTVATPTLANSGKDYGQLSSCFIVTPEDSLEGIYHSVTEAARLSKGGGGIGVYAGYIRSRGSSIAGHEGKSSGTIPFLKLFDATAVAVDQLGTRKGAIAVYQDVWHPDILAFLDLRLNNGDESNRAHNLHLGVNLPDAFMKAVEADTEWYLIDPYDFQKKYGYHLGEMWGTAWEYGYKTAVDNGDYIRSVPAKDIWRAILRSQLETGYPYMFYRDTVNAANPNKHMGTILSSNLCVTGDQLVPTSKGMFTVEELYNSGEELTLFDGEKAVKGSRMRKIAENAQVYRITTKSGREHRVTADHKVLTQRGMVAAEDIEVGVDTVPFLRKKGLFGDRHEPDLAFLLGLYHADGTQTDKTIYIDIWDGKTFDLEDEIKERIDRVYEAQGWTNYQQRPNFTECNTGTSKVRKRRMGSAKLKQFGFEKGAIPSWLWQSDEETQAQYLRGLYYADGTARLDEKAKALYVSLGSTDRRHLREVQTMLSNFGIVARIYLLRPKGKTLLPDGKGGRKEYATKTTWRLNISNRADGMALEELTGLLSRKGVKIEPSKTGSAWGKGDPIVAVEPDGIEDVYCTTVDTDEHIWVANTFITSNCSEILQNQSPDQEVYRTMSVHGEIREIYQSGDTVTCNLSSLALPNIIRNSLVSGKLHPDDEKRLAETIELQVTLLDNVIDLNTNLPSRSAQRTNERYRAVGAGVSGWHQLLAQQGIDWESDEATQFSDYLWERIAYYTIKASARLAKLRGAYPLFKGSDWQTGAYFEKRGYRGEEWDALKAEVAKGIRNGYLMAVAPTGSTSLISDTTAGLDAVTDIYYTEEKKDMRVPVVVPRLDSETYPYYKPAYLIDQSFTIQQAAARQRHIDQGQSLNLYLNGDAETQGGGKKAVKLSRWHLEGWKAGLKTTYYVRSRTVMAESCVWCE